MSASDSGSLVGQRIAHYEILGKLGAGGMGEVYLARDEQLHRNVAIKVLPGLTTEEPTARARLVREARAAAALNHPHICTVHEVGEAAGRSYIAMELVEGETLSGRLDAGPLPADQVVRYGTQLADALAHAHERGVVHRDLKSANVIITPDARVKVLDFGLARRLAASDLAATATQFDATFSEPGTVAGTLAYMAPEQLRGQVAQAPSDVWAFGVMLYEMATGRRPFQGDTGFELSAAILSKPAPPLPESIPADVQSVIARCLQKEPGQRYRTAGELRAALDVIGTGPDAARVPTAVEPVVTTRAPLSTRIRELAGRRALWLGAAVMLATAIGFGAWRYWPGPVRELAVLPFENTAKEPELDYLCEGLADSLIKQISSLSSFRVRNLSRVLQFKGQSVSPVNVGRQLGVHSVLSGTLELKDSRLVVSAVLTEVSTGREQWKNTYDREISRDAPTVLVLQEEIAGSIMQNGLRLRLTSQQLQQLVRRPTKNGEAYDLYLQARHLQRQADEDSYLQARELLKKAVALDPDYALAWSMLSGIHAMMATDGLERPADAWQQVIKYMKAAERIDPGMPEVLGYQHALQFLYLWDWEASAKTRRELLSMPLNDFDPHVMRAMAVELWALGRTDQALQMARRTRELDPLNPYLAVLEADYLLRDGQLEAASRVYEGAMRRDSGNLNAYYGLAEVRHRQGRFDDAIELRRQVHAAAGDNALIPVLMAAKGEQGYRQIQHAWVRLQLAELKAREPTKYVSPLDFARAHAQLGEKDQAFEYLERAFVERSPGLVFLKVDPAWDGIRQDPRFAAVVKRIGLPDL